MFKKQSWRKRYAQKVNRLHEGKKGWRRAITKRCICKACGTIDADFEVHHVIYTTLWCELLCFNCHKSITHLNSFYCKGIPLTDTERIQIWCLFVAVKRFGLNHEVRNQNNQQPLLGLDRIARGTV